MPRQLLNPVDIETVELRLSDPTIPEALVDEVYRFGQTLFSEMLSRGSEMDRKLTNMLGWSTATLAFLFSRNEATGTLKVLTAAAIIFALGGALLSAIALRTRMWPAPSERDWFKSDIQAL